jgi:phosphoribosylamine--glycine ligase
MANKGYPGSYQPDSIIKQLDTLSLESDKFIYHSGTRRNEQGDIIASGGRVLSITATAKTYSEAREKAYDTVAQIKWENGFYRTDIGIF